MLTRVSSHPGRPGQRRFFNVPKNRAKLETQGVDVGEWNNASRGKDLPEKAKKKRSKKSQIHAPWLSAWAEPFFSKTAVEQALWGIAGPQWGDPSVLGSAVEDNVQSKQTVAAPPAVSHNNDPKSAELFDAVKVAQDDESREVWDRFFDDKKVDPDKTLMRPGPYDPAAMRTVTSSRPIGTSRRPWTKR